MRTVFFDTETGGLNMTDPTIEIAAIAVDSELKELDLFQCKIEFDPKLCNPKALEINKYTKERWAEAKAPLQACQYFGEFLSRYGDIPMVSNRSGRPYKLTRVGGYNLSAFDLPRVSAMFKQLGVFFPAKMNPTLDVMHGAAWYFDRHPTAAQPENYSQAVVAQTLGIEFELGALHDALADVRLCVEIARRIRK